jgi:hypothetical protein
MEVVCFQRSLGYIHHFAGAGLRVLGYVFGFAGYSLGLCSVYGWFLRRRPEGKSLCFQ